MQIGAKTMQKRPTLSFPAVLEDGRAIYDYRDWSAYSLENYEIRYLHFHCTAEIALCLEGSGICCLENQEQPFSAGDVQLILPYMRHYHKSNRGDPAKWIWMNLDVGQLLSSVGITDLSVIERRLSEQVAAAGILDKTKFPRTVAAIEQLIQGALYDRREDLYYQDKLALQFYLAMVALFEESKDLPKIEYAGKGRILSLEPALREINRCLDLGTEISIGVLAEICGYSQTNFRRIFHEVFECSPMEYLSACRIRRAKNLLQSDKMSILEIALAVGYQDASAFNRTFLRIVGMTPSTYRRSVKIKNK